MFTLLIFEGGAVGGKENKRGIFLPGDDVRLMLPTTIHAPRLQAAQPPQLLRVPRSAAHAWAEQGALPAASHLARGPRREGAQWGEGGVPREPLVPPPARGRGRKTLP